MALPAPTTPHHLTALHLAVSGRTHVGAVRKRNEDRIGIGGWRSDRLSEGRDSRHRIGGQPLLMALSDGMGGYEGGEVASHCVLNRLQKTRWTEPRPDAVTSALREVARDLHQRARRAPQLALMGATVAGVIVFERALVAFNVGDSRIYRLRAGRLRQLSIDDRVAGSNMLTQALTAAGPPTDAHIVLQDARQGDVLLLCSDGLSEAVSDREIRAALGTGAARAADELLRLALFRGARDNVSLITAKLSHPAA